MDKNILKQKIIDLLPEEKFIYESDEHMDSQQKREAQIINEVVSEFKVKLNELFNAEEI